MPEPIRVRDDETGAEYSTYAVDENGKSYDGLTVLKGEKAVDDTGTLLPPKYPDPAADEVAVVADEPPASTESTSTEPPAAEPTAEVVGTPTAADTTAVESPASKPSAKAPRPTEPTTGPKATSKES